MSTSQPRVLVTPRSLTSAGLENVPELAPIVEAGFELVPGPAGRVPTADELRAALTGDESRVVGYLAGVETIPADVLTAATALKVISRNGVGVDGIDMDAARAAGIAVEIARAANAQGVAELAVLQILSTLRLLADHDSGMKDGGWERDRGRELAGRTLGIVGLGSIGRIVARVASAIGADVVASDPFVHEDETARLVRLPELFATADVVTLHSPPGDRPVVDREVLATMRDGAVLVNTARSALVDDDAVLEALESGRLAAYAVDAFDSEPPEVTPLLRHPRCHPTPHLGGFTDESVSRATAFAVQNLLRALASGEGGEPR